MTTLPLPVACTLDQVNLLLGDCPDERFARLAAEVWNRIPNLDRHQILAAARPIIYRPGESPTSASIISTHGPFDGVDAGAYFANLAQIHYEIVYFYESEGAQAKSDADLLFEIALILAHIVLRFSMFNNLFMVLLNQGKYPGLGNLRMADLEACLGLQVELLLVVSWGFEAEWAAARGDVQDQALLQLVSTLDSNMPIVLKALHGKSLGLGELMDAAKPRIVLPFPFQKSDLSPDDQKSLIVGTCVQEAIMHRLIYFNRQDLLALSPAGEKVVKLTGRNVK